jgi:hypothetical protein
MPKDFGLITWNLDAMVEGARTLQEILDGAAWRKIYAWVGILINLGYSFDLTDLNDQVGPSQ